MKVYVVKILIGNAEKEYMFTDHLPAVKMVERFKDLSTFYGATIETYSNGGDDAKAMYLDDFEEF